MSSTIEKDCFFIGFGRRGGGGGGGDGLGTGHLEFGDWSNRRLRSCSGEGQFSNNVMERMTVSNGCGGRGENCSGASGGGGGGGHGHGIIFKNSAVISC